MDVEAQIKEKMRLSNISRIEAIAALDLGKRSEAAKRVVIKRKKRLTRKN